MTAWSAKKLTHDENDPRSNQEDVENNPADRKGQDDWRAGFEKPGVKARERIVRCLSVFVTIL